MMYRNLNGPPVSPPPDIIPTISPEEERAIINAITPFPEPEPDFLKRNSTTLLIGGGTLVISILLLILLVKI